MHLCWFRPGIEEKRLDTNLREPDLFDETEPKHNDSTVIAEFGHSIGISFESSIKETTLRFSLANPTVYVLTIGMQDLLDWVLSGFGFSTLRRSESIILIFVKYLFKFLFSLYFPDFPNLFHPF